MCGDFEGMPPVKAFARDFVRAMNSREVHLRAYRDLFIAVVVLMVFVGLSALSEAVR